MHKIVPSKKLTKNEEKSCAKATYYLKIRFRAQRGEILYSRGNISSGKTVYIEL